MKIILSLIVVAMVLVLPAPAALAAEAKTPVIQTTVDHLLFAKGQTHYDEDKSQNNSCS